MVFDWDKTLSSHYMQKPIFQEYGVDEKQFWVTSNSQAYANSSYLGLQCFIEHAYLNSILDLVRNGTLPGLNNKKLSELGKKIVVYPGVEDLFHRLKTHGVEIYIVTSGIRSMLKEIPFVKDCVTEIFGADYTDYVFDKEGNIIPCDTIQSLVRTVIPSDKVRILNEISKGSVQGKFDACVWIPENERRIPFKHIIYVGDGVSDIYAFETVRSGGGYAVGVYSPTDPQFEQIETIREDGFLDILGLADFGVNSTVGTWIIKKVEQLQFSLRKEEQTVKEDEFTQVRKHSPKIIHSWGKTK